MRTLLLIALRECKARMHRPSFWLLTVLVPLVLAAIYAMPVISASRHVVATTVVVVDETGLFAYGLRDTEAVRFRRADHLEQARALASDGDAVLLIPLRQTTIPHDAFLYYDRHEPALGVQSVVDNQLQQLLRDAIMEDVYHLPLAANRTLAATHIAMHTRPFDEAGESRTEVKQTLGVALGVVVALAIIIFGMQAMRAVQEERQNRMGEVMATTVRPLHLLGGKMCGVMATAVVQLVLWVVVGVAAVAGIKAAIPEPFQQLAEARAQQSVATRGSAATAQLTMPATTVDSTIAALDAISLPTVAVVFALCFLLGLMMYGGAIAAVAARLDSDADALQWMLLVGSPLLLAAALGGVAVAWPHGGLALWLSVIPPTAPVGLMLRLPFGIAWWQVAVAIVGQVLTIAIVGWQAAKAYRLWH